MISEYVDKVVYIKDKKILIQGSYKDVKSHLYSMNIIKEENEDDDN